MFALKYGFAGISLFDYSEALPAFILEKSTFVKQHSLSLLLPLNCF